MAWVSLVIIAGLLWYGQEEGVIRIQAWEPAALLLSAYSAFLAIFGWLLFAPERKSAEESPALFFSGMLTLIPPCFIAYHLMPPLSPLRGWLTLGLFVFGLFAILSPLPDEVFAVPRDRKSYLKPLTDCYLSALDVEEPQLDLQDLVPRSYYTLTRPDAERPPDVDSRDPRDPWTDPFRGTGRTMSEVGSARRPTYSESRSRGPDVRSGSAPLREPVSQESIRDATYREPSYRVAASRDRTHEEYRDRSLPQAREMQRAPGLGYPVSSISPLPAPPMQTTIPPDPTIQTTSGLSRPPMTARSAFAPRESRAPNYQPQSTTQVTGAPQTTASSATAVSITAPRRPLTEPGGRTTPPVGFQTPPALRPVTSSPSPVPRELPSRAAPPVFAPSMEPRVIAAATPLASTATCDDVLASAVSEFRSISDSDLQVTRPQDVARPLLDTESRSSNARPSTAQPARAPETDIREQDRRFRELEANHSQDEDSGSNSVVQSVTSSKVQTSPLNDVKMERLVDEQGGEMIDGTIRVFFEVGQKRAHLHVPFSPPLAGLPEVECEAVSDDSVRCKVALRQPYGIRIEARRSDASRPLNTDIGFAAVYTPSTRRG